MSSPALSTIRPPSVARLDASSTPVWLMTLRVTVSAPAAVSRIAPPSARIGLAVIDQRIERLGADAEADQAVAGEIERDALAGAHGDRALRCADRAGVGDLRRNEGDVAARRGGDRAEVLDGAAGAAEGVPAGQEIIVADVERRGDQRRALTRAPLPNSTPFGLTRNTWPLAVSCPSMRETVGPLTRFRVTAESLGCAKLTCASLPMSKPCQLMMARWLDCVMSMRVPLVAIAAWPPRRCRRWAGLRARGRQRTPEPPAAATSAAARPTRTRPELRLPQARASSDATPQALSRSFQIRRYALFMVRTPIPRRPSRACCLSSPSASLPAAERPGLSPILVAT